MAKVRVTTLVDSVIVIDHFNGIAEATKYLAEMHAQLAVSRHYSDALQAALAKHHNLKLATRDTDDFPPERYRFVRIPYTV